MKRSFGCILDGDREIEIVSGLALWRNSYFNVKRKKTVVRPRRGRGIDNRGNRLGREGILCQIVEQASTSFESRVSKPSVNQPKCTR